MGTFFVVLIVTIFGSVFTDTSYDELHDISALMDKRGKSMEDQIWDTVEISRKIVPESDPDKLKTLNLGVKGVTAVGEFFKTEKGKKMAEKAIAILGKSVKSAAKFLPFAGLVLDIAEGVDGMLSDESDFMKTWADEFMTKIMSKVDERDHRNQVLSIGFVLETIRLDVGFINQTIQCIADKFEEEHPNQEYTGSLGDDLDKYEKICRTQGISGNTVDILRDLQTIANAFTKINSPFRQYPLVGAPVLIELGLIAAFLDPLAREIVPGRAYFQNISCTYRNGLVDLIPYVLEARFEKVNAALDKKTRVRSEAFNAKGYNGSLSMTCEKNCQGDNCLTDAFGTEKFSSLEKPYCEVGYLEHVRHLVENMFPIDRLNETCAQPLKQPTGSGWATIKLKKLQAFHRADAVYDNEIDGCQQRGKAGPCNPFVAVFLHEDKKRKLILKTDTRFGTAEYNVDRWVRTKKITKSDTITVQIWHDRTKHHEYDPDRDVLNHPILSETGTIQSFIEKPRRCSKPGIIKHQIKAIFSDNTDEHVPPNCIEVDIIWQDERN